MTLGITTLSIMTLIIMALSIMTLIIKTLSIMDLLATISIIVVIQRASILNVVMLCRYP
jgi:hypothetical protein